MRWSALLAVAFMLTGCPAITAQLDDATGTTLEERCQTRRSAVAAWDAIVAGGGDLSETQASLRLAYQVFIDEVCPPVTPAPE